MSVERILSYSPVSYNEKWMSAGDYNTEQQSLRGMCGLPYAGKQPVVLAAYVADTGAKDAKTFFVIGMSFSGRVSSDEIYDRWSDELAQNISAIVPSPHGYVDPNIIIMCLPALKADGQTLIKGDQGCHTVVPLPPKNRILIQHHKQEGQR